MTLGSPRLGFFNSPRSLVICPRISRRPSSLLEHIFIGKKKNNMTTLLTNSYPIKESIMGLIKMFKTVRRMYKIKSFVFTSLHPCSISLFLVPGPTRPHEGKHFSIHGKRIGTTSYVDAITDKILGGESRIMQTSHTSLTCLEWQITPPIYNYQNASVSLLGLYHIYHNVDNDILAHY